MNLCRRGDEHDEREDDGPRPDVDTGSGGPAHGRRLRDQGGRSSPSDDCRRVWLRLEDRLLLLSQLRRGQCRRLDEPGVRCPPVRRGGGVRVGQERRVSAAPGGQDVDEGGQQVDARGTLRGVRRPERLDVSWGNVAKGLRGRHRRGLGPERQHVVGPRDRLLVLNAIPAGCRDDGLAAAVGEEDRVVSGRGVRQAPGQAARLAVGHRAPGRRWPGDGRARNPAVRPGTGSRRGQVPPSRLRQQPPGKGAGHPDRHEPEPVGVRGVHRPDEQRRAVLWGLQERQSDVLGPSSRQNGQTPLSLLHDGGGSRSSRVGSGLRFRQRRGFRRIPNRREGRTDQRPLGQRDPGSPG